MDNQLSIYTPSNTKPEILEEIFVQRHKLLERSVAWCTESLTTTKKNHLLFVGPRGSGKTHMVSMTVNRLRTNSELKDKMLIVWLGEDDIVTNFLDLVLSVLRYLAREYDFSLECLKEAKGLKSDKAVNIMLECINQQLDGRKILLVKENLSEVFNGLKDMGQKQLRAYLQEQKNMILLATSQQLFKGVSSRDAVFFGFFDIHYLKPLSVEDAMELIEKVSALRGNEELRKFVKTAQGRYRVRALHHLAGGNQRLYMDLLSFLTKESLDDLVSALSKLADDLTPYFQERVKSLAPQQGLIVQKLCEIEGAISVKDLAEEMFIGERSVAKQLGDLKEKGYVLAHKRGKLTYYEISEPLMRLSLQVKHTRGKPLKILVLLLRAWYSDDELNVYEKIKSDKIFKEYLQEARTIGTTIIEKINHTANRELENAIKSEDDNKIIEICSDIIASPNISGKEDLEKCNAYFIRGNTYGRLKKYGVAITDFTNALEVSEENNNDLYASILMGRAYAYEDSSQLALAIRDYEYILNFEQLEDEIKNEAMYYYAEALYENGNHKLALDTYKKFIKLDNIPKTNKQQALVAMGDIYSELEDHNKAIRMYLKILKIKELYIKKELLLSKIMMNYTFLGEHEEVKTYAKKILKLKDIDSEIEVVVKYIYGVALYNTKEYQKAFDVVRNISDKKEDAVSSEILLLLSTLSYQLNSINEARNYLLKWHKYIDAKKEEDFINLKYLIQSIAVNQKNVWKTEIPFILETISESQELEYLGVALINSIDYFINTTEDISQFKNWQLLWEETGKDFEYLQPALKALRAVKLAAEDKSDKPLFSLPQEIRELVIPMVEDIIKG